MLWQQKVLAFEWSMIAVTAIMISIRLFVQIRYRQSPWREVLLVVAWLLYFGVGVCEILIFEWGSKLPADATDEQALPTELAYLVRSFIYKPSIYCCKILLLCFYDDLSPRYMYFKTWLAIKITWFFTIAALIIHFTYFWLLCKPVSLTWSWNHGQCGNSTTYVYVTWSFHLFTDILVYMIPFVILKNLTNLTRSQKLGALVMFIMGLINISTAAAIMATEIVFIKSVLLGHVELILLVLQSSTAIMIVCLPQLRRFFYDRIKRQRTGRTPNTSGASSSGWRSTGTGSKTPKGSKGLSTLGTFVTYNEPELEKPGAEVEAVREVGETIEIDHAKDGLV